MLRKSLKIIVSFILLLLMLASCQPSQATNNTVSTTTTSTTVVNYYDVTFVTNGGSSVSSKRVSELKEAPITRKDGYVFEGWYLDGSLNIAAIFPMQVNNDIRLYAKWLKVYDEFTCSNISLKNMSNDHSSSATYYITPPGFDLNRLESKGYSAIKITVSYDVYYRKDYDVLLDIGYLGAPKYDLKILNSDGYGTVKNKLETIQDSVHKTATFTILLSDLRTSSVTLNFSTENIQNIVYFKNIVVAYECY